MPGESVDRHCCQNHKNRKLSDVPALHDEEPRGAPKQLESPERRRVIEDIGAKPCEKRLRGDDSGRRGEDRRGPEQANQ